jgi:hypothetical protein
MVSMLTLSAIVCGFESRSGQIKDCKIDICYGLPSNTIQRVNAGLLFSAISWQEQVTFWWDDVCFVLNQHTSWDFDNASSPKQQFNSRNNAPLRHIILILSQHVFALSSFCMLSGEAANINFTVFDLTRSRLKPTNYCTQGEHANHYTINVVLLLFMIIINDIMMERYFYCWIVVSVS